MTQNSNLTHEQVNDLRNVYAGQIAAALILRHGIEQFPERLMTKAVAMADFLIIDVCANPIGVDDYNEIVAVDDAQ